MSDQNTLLSDLKAIRTESELIAFLRTLSRHFDFTGFLLFRIPLASDETLLAKLELSDLPRGLIESYDELGLVKNSQIFANLRRSTAPMTWSAEDAIDVRPSEQSAMSAQLFARYNITKAAFLPVHGPSGDRAGFGFLGNRKQLTHSELGNLAVFAAHAYNIYSTLKDGHRINVGLLTPRELEALEWAANGKTSGEIASILSLSEHTVNTYMNNAMRKLDCVNRTQLVAKALRLRLIW